MLRLNIRKEGRLKRFSWLVGVSLFLFLIGCAGRDDVMILDSRASSLERQLNALRDSNEGLKATLSRRIEQAEKKMDSSLPPIHQNQADITAQIEALKTKIQTLQGRIEAFEYNQKRDQNRLSESLVKELKEFQARLQRLEHPPTPPPPPPAVPSAAASPALPPPSEPTEAGPKPEKAKEITRDAKEDQKENKEPAKEREKTTKGTPEELYGEAGALFKKKAFEGAQKKYEDYLKAAPKGKYVEPARFGLAESLYAQKDYEEAILNYQKLIKGFPKSPLIPEVLYKQALSFLALKDSGSARLLLEKIIKSYPKSAQAKLAQKKLKSL